jgi:hypothetical protein
MILRWPIAVVLGLLPVVAVVAWSTQMGAHNVTAADKYRKQVNAICQSGETAQAALPTPTQPSDLGPYGRHAYKLAMAELAQVQAVAPPAELRADVARVLATERRSGAALRRYLPTLDRVRTKPQLRATVRKADRMQKRFNTTSQWQALGIPACAS